MHCEWLSCLFSHLWSGAVPQSSLTFMLTLLKITTRLFCGMSLNWICLMIFLWFTLGLGCFWKEDHTGKVLFSSHHIEGTNSPRDFWLLMLVLITWLRQGLWDFSTVKLLIPFLSFPFYLLGKEVTMCIIRSGESCSPPWGWGTSINYLESSVWEVWHLFPIY